jgi:DNA-binding NtrC family response regulator
MKEDAAAGGSGGRPIIVVVDDDVTMRKSLAALLSDLYEVRVAASANEGVAAVDRDVCAVVLDVRMKGFDGFWACDEIRKQFPDIPVIFYSAYQDAKDPYRIINEHRPFAYLTKDGDVDRLLESIASAVRLYRTTVENRRLVETLRRSTNHG